MVMLKTLDSSVISFIILFIIFIHSYNRHERVFAQHKLFNSLVLINMAMIVIDILGWVFNGLSGNTNYYLNTGFNLMLYIFDPLLPSTWILYTYYLTGSDDHVIKALRFTLCAIFGINAFVAVLSLNTGWFFYVDPSNIYHRGPVFLIHVGYCEALLIYSFFYIVIKRKQFQKRQLRSMLLFFIAPLVGTIFQAVRYGVSYNWTGIMISLLVIYMNLQTKSLNTDYLTEVNNRLHFQVYIKEKISNSNEKRTFGAIMIDIDNFKNINDTFGHGTGDEALRDAAQILKSSLRRDDFIARYGGDEFLAVIDVQTIKMLEDTIIRIKENIEAFNSQSQKPYNLNFSFGYDIYDVQTKMKPDDFLDHLDQLMYKDKNRKLKINSQD